MEPNKASSRTCQWVWYSYPGCTLCKKNKFAKVNLYFWWYHYVCWLLIQYTPVRPQCWKWCLINCINKPLVLAGVPPIASAPPTSLTKPSQPLITVIIAMPFYSLYYTRGSMDMPVVMYVAPLHQFVAYNTLEDGISVIDLYTIAIPNYCSCKDCDHVIIIYP